MFLFIGIRLDMIIGYAFIRITDNYIDEELDVIKKSKKLKIMDQFLDELFGDRKSDFDVRKTPYIRKIDWEKYKSELTNLEMASFRALSRIAFYLPRKPFYQVFEGYHLDIDGHKIRNEKDLMNYSNLVGGSFGPIVAYVVMYRCDDDTYDIVADYSYLIEKAYQLGRVSIMFLIK